MTHSLIFSDKVFQTRWFCFFYFNLLHNLQSKSLPVLGIISEFELLMDKCLRFYCMNWLLPSPSFLFNMIKWLRGFPGGSDSIRSYFLCCFNLVSVYSMIFSDMTLSFRYLLLWQYYSTSVSFQRQNLTERKVKETINKMIYYNLSFHDQSGKLVMKLK